MWPQLAMALASTLLQKQQEKRAYQQAQHQRQFDVENAIAARRSARAGDSGYTQSALAIPTVKRPESNAGQVLSQLGQALASQSSESDTPTKGYDASKPFGSRFAPYKDDENVGLWEL